MLTRMYLPVPGMLLRSEAETAGVGDGGSGVSVAVGGGAVGDGVIVSVGSGVLVKVGSGVKVGVEVGLAVGSGVGVSVVLEICTTAHEIRLFGVGEGTSALTNAGVRA